MNARFGTSVRNIPLRSSTPEIQAFTYPDISDNITSPNDNAYILSTICVDNDLIVMNNIKTPTCHFPSRKTFKNRVEWVSEIDTSIISYDLLNNINRFTIHQTDWLPSNHALISFELKIPRYNMDDILSRADNLGGHGSLMGQVVHERCINRSLRYKDIDISKFSDMIQNVPVPVNNDNDVHSLALNISKTLYDCASSCFKANSGNRGASNVRPNIAEISNTDTLDMAGSIEHYQNKWDRLLNDPDDCRVWKAIDWKGQLCESIDSNHEMPSDNDFKNFIETYLSKYCNERTGEPEENTICPNIPILDNQIVPVEVTSCIDKLKSNRGSGLDGLPPGIYKLLTPQWILLITALFNLIFTSATYPVTWTKAKLVMLFKRGDRKDPNNYRGISILNSIAKLYDMILCKRLELWFKPCREQAGAQSGRGCIEHIVSLRLLCNFANKKKRKLFITFVDFSKAYDLVPRQMLISVLKRLGCGAIMVGAISAMYSVTQSVIGTALVTTAIGVRQGSPTSCYLFIIYINDLIKLIKNTCEPDGFLSWLHLLALMDDTVLLATSREKLRYKIQLLMQFCNKYGMVINEKKTNLMVINGNYQDKEQITIRNITIKHCDKYTYLGVPFTSDGVLSSAVKAHAQERMAHFHKFIAFIEKNSDIPYVIKKRVFDACLLSAILYGCESWLNADLKPVIKIYNWALKTLLGVRPTTCNDVCYVESGYLPLKTIVISKQRKFFKQVHSDRVNMLDDPLGFVLKLVLSSRYTTKTYLSNLINTEINDYQSALQNLKNDITSSDSSRRVTYCNVMNPSLTVHNIYSKKHNISEYYRIAFTRFRVSSHSLAVETGRWNRRGRGRLPMDERVCSCSEIQTEDHVVSYCPLTQFIRDEYNFSSLTDLMSGSFADDIVCKIIFKVLKVYE